MDAVNTPQTYTPAEKRLIYQATRRGTREAEEIIGGFVRFALHSQAVQKDFLDMLVGCDDPGILAWLEGRSAPPSLVDSPDWAADLQAFKCFYEASEKQKKDPNYKKYDII